MLKYSDKILYECLAKNGLATAQDMNRAMAKAQTSNEDLYQSLVREKLVTEPQILAALATELELETVNLKETAIDKAVLDRVPVKLTWYYKFMPVKIEGRMITVAVATPMEVRIQDELRVYLGLEPRCVLTTSTDLIEALKKHYGLASDTIDKVLAKEPGRKTPSDNPVLSKIEDLEQKSEDASVSKIVNQVILEAYQKRATDIHIEPYRNKVRIRYRIDGILIDANLPADVRHLLLPMISRIKIMANLSIVEKRLPQDGSAVVKAKDQNLDLRVSTIPTHWGESMVIRILPTKVMLFSLEKLGIDPHNLRIIRSLLVRPHGIIFVTGPTGSGKTTTLYACLNELNGQERKIITIEDPIEYEMEGITQIQVNPKVKLDFATGLRSILRHDPNIIMVGEVRDLETAEIAIRTALTGHLVFSTLHTNDAASGITRLVDMGVEPFLVASSVEAFIAQRLVRLICPHCKQEDKNVPKELKEELAGALKVPDLSKVRVFHGAGCGQCNKTGYLGRTAIYEILIVDEAIRSAILENHRAENIKQIAAKEGMVTLRQAGWNKVMEGLTTPAEVMNVTVKEDESLYEKKASSGEPVPRDKSTEVPSRAVFPEAPPLKNEYLSRVYPRVTAEVPIRFKFAGQENKARDAAFPLGVEQATVTKDLSAGGLCFQSRYLIPLGTLLELNIQLAGETRSSNCFAKVCRVEQDNQRNTYSVVVYYLDMTSADRVKINNFVTGRLQADPKLKMEPYSS